ncbi:EAL domain-containing protein [Actinoplanes sp. NPDC049548]|uniref:EAL domain-containing protein n=1 Tax=Actinoplanes sp. NPDC049548 TaxID=3155152 RepID=UPI003424E7A9
MVRQQPSTVSALRRSSGSLIERIIAERAVYPVFQPIVDLATEEVVAVEALARGPAGSPLEFPDALFAAAISAGLLTELDQLCFARALETALEAGPLTPALLFVNAEPAGLSRPLSADLAELIYRGLPFRIVLEFTERALTSRPAALLRLADLVHRAGNAVALDDVGADPASLAFLPLVKPEVVKLDMHLVRDPYSADTQATAAAVSAYADRSGATVLAEGVETSEDAVNAVALGARWGQGWLFGRPGPLEAMMGRHRSAPDLANRPQPHIQAAQLDTPFAIASRRHAVRTANSDMADAVVDHVVATTLDRGRGGILLCVVNEPGQPPRWLPRLTAAVDRVTYLGLLGGSALTDVGDVHAQRLDDRDSLREETTIALLTEDFSTALCMRAAGPEDSDTQGLIEFVHSRDRQVVQGIIRNIMRRFDTW